jgi:hypothetical protein
MISSGHKRSGLLYQRWRDYYGKSSDDVLVVHGTTLQFNPSFDAKIIERALEEDPQRYGAEYLSQWRDDLSSWLSRDIIDAAIDVGCTVRPPANNIHYVAACDASGGRNDSFTAAIAHQDRAANTIVLDALYERKAPFDPSNVVNEIAQLLQSYHCSSVVGDKYAANWVSSAFSKARIRYIQCEQDRSQIYLNALPVFTSGRARLLDNSRLASQFASLERRVLVTGREQVIPGPGHDDLANSAAIAMTLTGKHAGPILVTDRALELSRMPDPHWYGGIGTVGYDGKVGPGRPPYIPKWLRG